MITALQPRRVAVAIPYSVNEDDEMIICLVSSRKHRDKYVLPKGGVEKGESSRQAAIREMWEEAGLKPTASSTSVNKENDETSANTIQDHKAHKSSPSKDANEIGFVPRAIYEAYEIKVTCANLESELQEWPEKKERTRRWTTVREALELIEWRRDIHMLLKRSTLNN